MRASRARSAGVSRAICAACQEPGSGEQQQWWPMLLRRPQGAVFVLGESCEMDSDESGMRYQVSSNPILSTNCALSLPPYPHSYPQTLRERAYG